MFPGYAVHAVTNGVGGRLPGGGDRLGGGDDSPTANGHDAVALYDKLGQVVLPLWHDDRPGWIAVMKGASARMPPTSTVTA